MNKILKLIGLGIGLSSVICNTLILIFNESFVVGVTRFIPENNQWIRIPEIIMGFVAIPILIFMIINILKEKKK